MLRHYLLLLGWQFSPTSVPARGWDTRDIVTLQFGFEFVNELDLDSSDRFPSRLRDWTGNLKEEETDEIASYALSGQGG